MDQTGDTARLAREARIWRAATCCLAALAVPGGITLAQNGAPAGNPIAVLEVPAGLGAEVRSDHFTENVVANRTTASGSTSITWSNGVRLTVPTAKVSFDRRQLQSVTLEP
jgi:hypothetical protein